MVDRGKGGRVPEGVVVAPGGEQALHLDIVVVPVGDYGAGGGQPVVKEGKW